MVESKTMETNKRVCPSLNSQIELAARRRVWSHSYYVLVIREGIKPGTERNGTEPEVI